METMRVGSIEAAVDLATRFRDEGRYDWFRGQTRAWPPVSSLYRLYQRQNPDEDARYQARLDLFCEWLADTDELRHLLEEAHAHECYAVLQHYGVPTHYIDFTTEPGIAAFFAADVKSSPPEPGESVIYCLDSADLTEFWETMVDVQARPEATIELVTPNVDHLWRLQAQRGVFVSADYNWEIDYPLDRIVFPASGPPAYPTVEQIYPLHKSPLEQMLDRYFDIEQRAFGRKAVREILDELKRGGARISWIRQPTPEGNFHPAAFEDPASLRTLWTDLETAPWRQPAPVTKWTSGTTLERLRLGPAMSSRDVGQTGAYGVRQALRLNPQLRERTVDWALADAPGELTTDDASAALRLVWNGMRHLPFTDEDLAGAMGTTCMLLMQPGRTSASVDAQLSAVRSVLPSPIRVEFAVDDGSYSVGYVSEESLRQIVRPDFAALLNAGERWRAAEVRQVLMLMYNPRLLFSFPAFACLFAREVIPTQVASGRSPVLCNPAQLTTFGLK